MRNDARSRRLGIRSRRAAAVSLCLLLAAPTACGRTYLYERTGTGPNSHFAPVGTRLVYWPPIMGSEAKDELKRMPDEVRRAADSWFLGCWRFRTSDGFEIGAAHNSIVDVVDGRLILTGPFHFPEPDPGDTTVEAKDVVELTSRDPFPMEIDAETVMVSRAFREGDILRIVSPDGKTRRAPAVAVRMVPPPAKIPYVLHNPTYQDPDTCDGDTTYFAVQHHSELTPAPVYVFDRRGQVFVFLRGCEEDETMINRLLSEPDFWRHRVRLRALDESTITEWEFDKSWGMGPAFAPILAITALGSPESPLAPGCDANSCCRW